LPYTDGGRVWQAFCRQKVVLVKDRTLEFILQKHVGKRHNFIIAETSCCQTGIQIKT